MTISREQGRKAGRALLTLIIGLSLPSCGSSGGAQAFPYSATQAASVATAPTISRATPGPRGSGATTLYWTASPGATSYNLYYTAGTTVSFNNGTRLSRVVSPFTISGLSENVPYAFMVTGVNDAGESIPSPVFTETLPYFGSDVPNFPVTGSDAANIDPDVPAWVRAFTNVRAFMEGDSIVIETRALPPYKSYYYSTTGPFAALHDDTVPAFGDPSSIAEQAIAMKIPSKPTVAPSPGDSGLGIVGIAINGVTIFNDEAAPGDSIADEVFSLDTMGGHPQTGDIYHYHVEPPFLMNAARNELLGVAIDGFPVFGPANSSGQIVFDAGGNASMATPPSQWSSANPNWVDATFDPALTNLPHYHVVDNYYEDTVLFETGTPKELLYMVGLFLGGTRGTITNFGQETLRQPR